MSGPARRGYVYFIRVGRFVKIGFAADPHHRLKTLASGGGRVLITPDDFDPTLPHELLCVVPGCRIRDERNMQILFAAHWVIGEWFMWSPTFERQMNGMQFVTHAERRRDLAAWRRRFGGVSHVKEERWGMQTPELLAHLAEWRESTTLHRAA